MVSHIDPPNQLIPRRPPSVSSRASTSRRHRLRRPQQLAQNEFPIFSQSGDVEIVIASINGRREQRYVLHRLILSQNSGYFELDTATNGPSQATTVPVTALSTSKTGGDTASIRSSTDLSDPRRSSSQSERKRWCYVLDWGNTPDDQMPILVQRTPTPTAVSPGPPPVSRNKPPTSSTSFFRSMSNLSALHNNTSHHHHDPPSPDDDLLHTYDNLFRIFYNHAPSLDESDITTAYTQCKALLYLADTYDALDVVGPRVDHHLLRFRSRLFKQIAKYPPSYLKLAVLAHSKHIFSEALIHIVGQWPQGAAQLRGQVEPEVLELIEDKIDELEETKAKVEAKLFRLTLTTSRGERVGPGNAFLEWLALSLFRQWVAENTTPPAPVGILKSSSAAVAGVSVSGTSSGGRHRQGSDAASASASGAGMSRRMAPQQQQQQQPTSPPASTFPNPNRVYFLLASSDPSAYLTHSDLKSFLKNASNTGGEQLYTRDNVRRFERRIQEIKNLARGMVAPLVRNCLELDVRGVVGEDGGMGLGLGLGLGHLTCTRVGEGEYPWEAW